MFFHTNDKLKCDECGFAYSTTKGLKQHKQLKHNLNEVEGSEGSSKTNVKADIIKRSTIKLEVECEYCSRTFACKSTLKRHKNEVHIGCGPVNLDFADFDCLVHKCDICEKRFRWKITIKLSKLTQ